MLSSTYRYNKLPIDIEMNCICTILAPSKSSMCQKYAVCTMLSLIKYSPYRWYHKIKSYIHENRSPAKVRVPLILRPTRPRQIQVRCQRSRCCLRDPSSVSSFRIYCVDSASCFGSRSCLSLRVVSARWCAADAFSTTNRVVYSARQLVRSRVRREDVGVE